MPPVQGINRARENNAYDPIEKNTYQQWVERLGIIFKELVITHGNYLQIRLLDELGMEMVRVDYDGKDARIVPEEELQDKSTRDSLYSKI